MERRPDISDERALAAAANASSAVSGPVASLRRFAWFCGFAPVASVLGLYALAKTLVSPPWQGIAADYLALQDRWLLLAWLGLAVLILPAFRWRWAGVLALPIWSVPALAAGVVALCYAGHRWLLMAYDLSRDEQMANFDASIYMAGKLAWPLPPEWQPDAAALNMLFMLPVARPVAWVSAYLLALWGCARRLWPECREAGLVALGLLVLSGQFMMSGMASFAMPAHLCLNLVWLWLFLGDRRRLDVLALAVGFVATGLHQPLFHPMFVAPWLVLLLWEKRWGRLALYALAYAVIGLFWLYWPHFTVELITGPQSLSAATGNDYLSRLLDVLAQNKQNLPLMAANLLRFVCWQNLLLLPLLFAGMAAARRDAKVAALAAGLVLPIVVMGVILPYQGHGFGYRYLHGLLGNAALLGAYGWRHLAPWQARLRPVLIAGFAASALVLLPMLALLAHQLYAPFARVNARIDASQADYVLIGAEDAPYALDLALNRADLLNRPIRLSAGDIADADALAHRICRKGVKLALPTDALYAPIDRLFHAAPNHAQDDWRLAQTKAFEQAGCAVSPLA